MDFSKRPVLWSLFAIAFVAGNFFFFRQIVAPALGADHEISILIAEKGIIAALLAALFLCVGGWRSAGFVAPRGYLWILMGGTIWFGILGAVPGAIAFVRSEPMLALGYGAVALLVAFGEEGVYRGIVLGALSRRSLWTAALISSLLFGATHLLALTHAKAEYAPFFIGQAGAAAAIGLLFAGLTLRYRSIIPAVFFHFLLDAVQFWNGGGVRSTVENTLNNLTPVQMAAGIGAAIVLFGGWGALLVWLEVRRRARAEL